MNTKFQLLVAGMLLATVRTGIAQPIITNQPQSCTNVIGTTATFTVGATGTEPLAYQWQFNGANLAETDRIIGTATATLTISSVQSADAGLYTVVITNGFGSITSIEAALDVLPGLTRRLLQSGFCEGITVGDVFGDGNLRLVAAFPKEGKVRIYDRNYALLAELAFNEPPRALAIGDTDGNGHPELVVGTAGNISGEGMDPTDLIGVGADAGGYLYVGSALPDGTFQEKWRTPIASIRFADEIAVADLNGNGLPEIIVGRSWWDRRLTVFEYSAAGYQTIFDDDIGSDVNSVCPLQNQLLVGTACWWDYALRVYDTNYAYIFRIGGDATTFVAGGDLQGDGQQQIVGSFGATCTAFVLPTLQVYTNQFSTNWGVAATLELVNTNTTDYAMVTMGHLLPGRGKQIVAGGMSYNGPNPDGEFLKVVAYANGRLAEVWSERFANPVTDVYGLCCADLDSSGIDELYVGATDGLYVYSAGYSRLPWLTISLTNGAAALKLWGAVGTTNLIEYANQVNSSTQWLLLTTLYLPYSPYQFLDPSPTNTQQRFYRAVQLP